MWLFLTTSLLLLSSVGSSPQQHAEHRWCMQLNDSGSETHYGCPTSLCAFIYRIKEGPECNEAMQKQCGFEVIPGGCVKNDSLKEKEIPQGITRCHFDRSLAQHNCICNYLHSKPITVCNDPNLFHAMHQLRNENLTLQRAQNMILMERFPSTTVITASPHTNANIAEELDTRDLYAFIFFLVSATCFMIIITAALFCCIVQQCRAEGGKEKERTAVGTDPYDSTPAKDRLMAVQEDTFEDAIEGKPEFEFLKVEICDKEQTVGMQTLV